KTAPARAATGDRVASGPAFLLRAGQCVERTAPSRSDQPRLVAVCLRPTLLWVLIAPIFLWPLTAANFLWGLVPPSFAWWRTCLVWCLLILALALSTPAFGAVVLTCAALITGASAVLVVAAKAGAARTEAATRAAEIVLNMVVSS